MKWRLQSIDFIRGCAIVFMIQSHIWQYYIGSFSGSAAYFHRWLIGPLGASAAPLFTFISGVSAGLACNALRSRGAVSSQTSAQYRKRGVALFLLATFVSAIEGPVLHVLDVSPLNWSVIQLVGFCLCLAPLYVRLDLPLKALWLAVPLAFTVIHPQSGPLVPFTTGFAPLLPWGFLFFAGTSVGSYYVSAAQAPTPQPLAWLGAAGLLLLVPVGLVSSRVVAPLSLAHWEGLTLTSLAVFLGSFILFMAFCGYWLDFRGFRHRILNDLSGLGQHALTAYYLQLFGVVVSVKAIAWVTGRSPHLDIVWFLPLTVLALLVLYVILSVFWARHNYVFTLEWLLARWVRGGSRVLRP